MTEILNSVSAKINLKYTYLFTVQEVEKLAYHSIASLLAFAPGQILRLHYIF